MGDVQSLFIAGRLAATGAIGYVNIDEEARCFLAAAEKGHPTAAAQLGQLYSGAHGFVRRRMEAIRWRRFAAQGGHVSAESDPARGALLVQEAGIVQSGASACATPPPNIGQAK